jgi:hypothetical protein
MPLMALIPTALGVEGNAVIFVYLLTGTHVGVKPVWQEPEVSHDEAV